MKKWSSVYWANDAAPCAEDDPLALRVEVTKHHRSGQKGDCAVSQGLFLSPDESEIRHASDSHWMVILKGVFANPATQSRSAPPPASMEFDSSTRTCVDSDGAQPPIASLPLQGAESPNCRDDLESPQSNSRASSTAASERLHQNKG